MIGNRTSPSIAHKVSTPDGQGRQTFTHAGLVIHSRWSCYVLTCSCTKAIADPLPGAGKHNTSLRTRRTCRPHTLSADASRPPPR